MGFAGKFIVIDGPDGSGKGTQLERLTRWLEHAGEQVVRAKDPGGTVIGDRIRHILLNYDLSEMAPRCEALLFMASRAQLVAEVVQPALDQGKVVLGDRFISATCAYQVAAGFAAEDVLALGKLAVGQVWPDLTLVLDVPPEVGFNRTGRTPQKAASRRKSRAQADQFKMFSDADIDAMEERPLEFHRRVREEFRRLPERYPRPVEVIDATVEADAVFARITEALQRAFQ